MKIRFIIIFLFIFGVANAQESLDSLLEVYNSAKKNVDKIEILDELSDEAYNYSLDSAIYYCKLSVFYSKKDKDNEKIVDKILYLGKLYIYNGEYDSSVVAYLSSIPYAEKSQNKKLLGLAIHSTGNGYLFSGDKTSALEYYQKALDIRQEIQDTIGIAATTNNIGRVYWDLKQDSLALKYFSLSLKYELIAEHYDGIATSYNNIGLIYWRKLDLDSAIYFIKKSVQMHIKNGSKSKSLALSYNNLGILFQKLVQYDSSLYYFNKSLILNKKNYDKLNIANVYNNIATSLSGLNRIDECTLYIDSSFVIAKEINDFEILKNTYSLYAVVNYNKKNFKKAYEFLSMKYLYADSLYNENITKQIAEMQTKYETDKKQKEIELQNLTLDKKNSELNSQHKLIVLFIVFFAVIFILFIFLTRLYNQKRKANNLLSIKNAEITQQNEEIETQSNNLVEANNELIAQKEKIEIQKELLSEKNEFVESSIRYASTIQNASLPLQSDIDKYFENFIIYLPKDIVSGDFYFFSDVINSKTNKKELFFVVADCTGHGVPGAFMSMIGIRFLNKYINENKIDSPAEILKRLDKDVHIALKQESSDNRDGMDVIVCKFSDIENEDNFTLTYSGAKRNLYYYNSIIGEISKIYSTKKSIGGLHSRDIDFEESIIKLKKQDTVYLYSDGIIDQNNFDRKKFGTTKLLNILTENEKETFDNQNLILLSELEKWQINTTQRDDISFVALRLK